MSRHFIVTSHFIAFLLSAPALVALAQAAELPAPAGAQKEHALLQKFAGQWDSDNEAVAEPGQPAMKCKGTWNCRMLGDLWMVTESNVEMMGTKVNAIQTIGYSPEKKKYVGTWVDSVLNHLWHYDGTVDSAGTTLTLEAEGPSFTQPGKVAMFRDSYEFKSPDHIVVRGQMQDEQGKWVTFMTGNLRRKK